MGLMSGDNADNPAGRSGDDLFGEDAAATGRHRRNVEPGHHLPAAGMLLVAMPTLADPNFRRTVVYLVAHGPDGSAGLILNRRTETSVQSVLPTWTAGAARPQAVFAGGPVQRSGAMCLGITRAGVDPAEVPGAVRVAGSVLLIDLDSDPTAAAQRLDGVRIFAGHAGWGGGQLAAEIEQGAWRVCRGRSRDVVVGPRVDLWFRVLRRQGFPTAWQAYLPTDVRAN